MGRALVAVLSTAALTACGGSPTTPPATVTVTASGSSSSAIAPPAPTATDTPHSELVGIELPPGSIDKSTEQPDMEYWLVTTPYDYTVSFLRDQLPITQSFHGLAWCSQDINGRSTQWAWGDADQLIVITVSVDGHVVINKGPDSAGC